MGEIDSTEMLRTFCAPFGLEVRADENFDDLFKWLGGMFANSAKFKNEGGQTNISFSSLSIQISGAAKIIEHVKELTCRVEDKELRNNIEHSAVALANSMFGVAVEIGAGQARERWEALKAATKDEQAAKARVAKKPLDEQNKANLLAAIRAEIEAQAPHRKFAKSMKFAQVIRPGVLKWLGVVEGDEQKWPSAGTIKASFSDLK